MVLSSVPRWDLHGSVSKTESELCRTEHLARLWGKQNNHNKIGGAESPTYATKLVNLVRKKNRCKDPELQEPPFVRSEQTSWPRPPGLQAQSHACVLCLQCPVLLQSPKTGTMPLSALCWGEKWTQSPRKTESPQCLPGRQ